MIKVSHRGNEVLINGNGVKLEYDVREAFELDGQVIVLLDPNAYLQDPGYGKERRRGDSALRNLRALSTAGHLLWEAEFHEAADYYYKIVDRYPLTALSFSSFRCVIDSATGRILSKEFCK
jgi:hypothetical protein